MTGAGFRTFSAGAILAGTAVQDYLMDQAVMNFAGTAARGSALPSPSEGMVAHVGGGTVTVYNGTAWATVGGSFAFQTYTPTFTGITVGNGTTVARFVQIGKFVYGYISFTLGSTSSVTGNVTMTTPTTMDFATSDTFIMSDVQMKDIGIADIIGHATVTTTTTFTVLAQLVSSTYNTQALVSSTVPFTWGNTDKILVTFAYHSV